VENVIVIQILIVVKDFSFQSIIIARNEHAVVQIWHFTQFSSRSSTTIHLGVESLLMTL